MSSELDAISVPAELRELGEFVRVFESSGSSVLATIMRGLFPLPFAIGMIAAAEIWLKPRDWKYYLLVAAGVAMFRNGCSWAILPAVAVEGSFMTQAFPPGTACETRWV